MITNYSLIFQYSKISNSKLYLIISINNRPAEDYFLKVQKIATQMCCHAQNTTYMLYQALFKSLSKIGCSKIILDNKDYVIHIGGQKYCSGTLLLKVVLNKMHLETKAATCVSLWTLYRLVQIY